MIPKTIHYCWFGKGEKPDLIKNCIESWNAYCPDYQIIEWNEENFEFSHNRYAREAYEAKKYAFVSDYVRLCVLYEYGGIYLDTDVMLLKSFDDFLMHRAFGGFEKKEFLQSGVLGFERHNEVARDLMCYYDDARFVLEDGTLDMTPNVEFITRMFVKWGGMLDGMYQEVRGMTIYPKKYFAPKLNKINNKKYMKDAVCIHYFASSWKNVERIKRESSFLWKYIIEPLGVLSRCIERIGGRPYKYFKRLTWDKYISKMNSVHKDIQ